jgi:hypothetical protein
MNIIHNLQVQAGGYSNQAHLSESMAIQFANQGLTSV